MKNKKIKKNGKKSSKKIPVSKEKKIYREKIKFLIEIIQNTVLYVQKYKLMDIIDAGELNICIHNLENNFKLLNQLNTVLKGDNIDYSQLNKSINEISEDIKTNIRLYGTGDIEKLLKLIIKDDYIEKNINSENKDIYSVIKKYVHPISYKIMSWREKNANDSKKK